VIVNCLQLKAAKENASKQTVMAPTYVCHQGGGPKFILLECLAKSTSNIVNSHVLESARKAANRTTRTASEFLCVVWFVCGNSDYIRTFSLTPGDIERVEERDDWQKHKYVMAK
jgi:hypothetical protein